MDIPHAFTDEMAEGAFKYFRHQHQFEAKDDGTLMTDIFEFEAPFGILGKIVSVVILMRYMHNLLSERNAFIKTTAEKDCNRITKI